MSGSAPVLACGVAGTALDAGERDALVRLGPGGVILFARNVAGRGQLAALTAELRGLPSHPAVAVDLEGGRVNRLRPLLGELPSPAGEGSSPRSGRSRFTRPPSRSTATAGCEGSPRSSAVRAASCPRPATLRANRITPPGPRRTRASRSPASRAVPATPHASTGAEPLTPAPPGPAPRAR